MTNRHALLTYNPTAQLPTTNEVCQVFEIEQHSHAQVGESRWERGKLRLVAESSEYRATSGDNVRQLAAQFTTLLFVGVGQTK